MTKFAAITGWGSAVPEKRLTNADLEKLVETTDDWIVQRTGIRERRMAGTGESTSTLATAAARLFLPFVVPFDRAGRATVASPVVVFLAICPSLSFQIPAERGAPSFAVSFTG